MDWPHPNQPIAVTSARMAARSPQAAESIGEATIGTHGPVPVGGCRCLPAHRYPARVYQAMREKSSRS